MAGAGAVAVVEAERSFPEAAVLGILHYTWKGGKRGDVSFDPVIVRRCLVAAHGPDLRSAATFVR